jgi:hypothetical protein
MSSMNYQTKNKNKDPHGPTPTSSQPHLQHVASSSSTTSSSVSFVNTLTGAPIKRPPVNCKLAGDSILELPGESGEDDPSTASVTINKANLCVPTGAHEFIHLNSSVIRFFFKLLLLLLLFDSVRSFLVFFTSKQKTSDNWTMFDVALFLVEFFSV